MVWAEYPLMQIKTKCQLELKNKLTFLKYNCKLNINKRFTIITEMEKTMKIKTKEITLTALMTAVICILGPISLAIPVSPVPISLGTFAIYLTSYLLGMKRGTISCLIYLLMGAIGLPVFTGFTGGIGKVLGPTGGYMIGYIFMALICGFFVEKWNGKIFPSFMGMISGTVVLYAFGTVWLAYQNNMSFGVALAAGVLPFIAGDIAKIILVLLTAPQICRRLKMANLNVY